MNDVPTEPRDARRPLIDRLVLKARLALAWESAWPALAAALSVVLLFLSASWFGLWDALPPLARMAGVLLFGLAVLAALAPLLKLGVPDRRALLSRVDRASGLTHRPATSLDDRLAPQGDDPLTRALWRAHRDRMDVDARNLRAGAPSPRLAARDPFALRFLMGLVVVVAFAVAGSDRGARVGAAFDWSTPAGEVAAVRIDAWVAPPSYTGRPPLFLTGARPAGAAAGDARAAALPTADQVAPVETLRVPTGSTLVIRGAGGTVDIAANGAAEAVEISGRPPEGVTERRFKLVGDADIAVGTAGETARTWRFSVIPDAPPTIALKGPPQRNARGSTTIAYDLKDDYGVAGADARFALKAEPKPPKARMPVGVEPGGDGPTLEKRPLYEAPKVNLALPRARAREGQAQTSLDLMEHPWAGADVIMTLHARDEAGQDGSSAALDMRLPQRAFTNPLARALVEQRRELALDANAKPAVAKALQALMMFPEEFTPQAAIYLGLRTAYRRLDIARTDDELRGAADYLWEIALRIEDGDLPQAERELRQAEEALRKALEEGASEKEIAKLTQDLRAALDKFMKELAQRAPQQPNSQAQKSPNGAKAVRPEDLRKMIDRMEQMAKNGSREQAQQALNELREMLDNLQTAQKQQQQDPGSQAQQQQMDKLQDMIREQNKLRDKTYQQYRQSERAEQNKRGQQGRRQPQQGKPGQKGEQGDMQALADQQKALRDKLDQIMKDMQDGQGQQGEPKPGQQGKKGQGQPGKGEQQQGQGEQGEGQQPGQQGQQGQSQGEGQGEGENALGEAGKSMGAARGALGEGATGQALDDQGRALDNLRKGAQALAKQMQEGQQGGQPGGKQPGQQGQQGQREGEDGRDDDPLGRPTRRRDSDGTTTKVPGEIEAQRARRVLEELRRRLGESERPREELDYLERLLTP